MIAEGPLLVNTTYPPMVTSITRNSEVQRADRIYNLVEVQPTLA
jgi:hypothetical protein